jgi:transforming growth factor-beta-induced protein
LHLYSFIPKDDIACGTDDFSTLCSLLTDYDLALTLSRGNWTVFAPTNAAFEELEEILATLEEETFINVLLYHTVPNKVLLSDDLNCGELLEMANGKDTRTKCDDGKVTYQVGSGNPDDSEPAFVEVDIVACNGVIHILDKVMLPGNLA